MTLFDPGEPIAPEAAPGAELGPDARRTLRRNQLLAAGFNPRTRLPLLDPNPEGYTCANCVFHFERRMANAYQTCGHGYPINAVVKPLPDGTLRFLGVSNGPATDVRLSWPACAAFVEKVPCPSDYLDALRRGENPTPPPGIKDHSTPNVSNDGPR